MRCVKKVRIKINVKIKIYSRTVIEVANFSKNLQRIRQIVLHEPSQSQRFFINKRKSKS